ncbi:S-layer homology domain-containing protein [Paenibacillus sp. MMS18-CY102]|uniref:S-layer homology domain-containing protein n=1 Tax=Paenibacillus sp. MMS18-CY102 TaxID=2682849 RepID=UPI001365BC51|nr:S-layer homology domain-containing protein [Paenibacillus sp. MMS18-CY102]MWC30809.1 hypothetical protein [Paenibacillus sp. MMS18-CY102]
MNLTHKKRSTKQMLMAASASLLLANALLISPAAASAASRNVPSVWAKADVDQANAFGLIPYELMSDYQKPITRAELSAVVVRLYERLTGKQAPSPAENPFTDTQDANVRKAYALELVGGTGAGTFSPNSPVTREQLAVMLYNTINKAGFADKLKGSAAPSFADAATIAVWAKEASGKLAAANVLQGSQAKEGLLFRPKANASREQIFSLAYRIASGYGPIYINSESDLLASVGRKGQSLVFNDARAKQIYQEAVRVNAAIIKPGMTDFEKELAIHDYLVLHTAYDYDNYLKDTVPTDSYSAYGSLFRGTAVCQGYAYAAHIMLELEGIDSQIVTGTANGVGHAWNKVKIDGEYYNLDVTWDDPVPDKQGRLVYSYFNVPDAALAKDHKWTASEWPAATATAYDYFEYNGWAVHSAAELKGHIGKALASRETEIKFKATYEGDEIADMKAALQASNVVSGYSYAYSGRAFTLTVRYR